MQCLIWREVLFFFWFAAREFDSGEFNENNYSIFPVVTHVASFLIGRNLKQRH